MHSHITLLDFSFLINDQFVGNFCVHCCSCIRIPHKMVSAFLATSVNVPATSRLETNTPLEGHQPDIILLRLIDGCSQLHIHVQGVIKNPPKRMVETVSIMKFCTQFSRSSYSFEW
jgi:hypothetical protein